MKRITKRVSWRQKDEKTTYNPGIECSPKQADQGSAKYNVVNVCALNDRVDLE